MNVRIAAIASLAGEVRALTIGMGQMLMRAATSREQSRYYEDHF